MPKKCCFGSRLYVFIMVKDPENLITFIFLKNCIKVLLASLFIILMGEQKTGRSDTMDYTPNKFRCMKLFNLVA